MQDSKRLNKHVGEILLKEPNYELRARVYIGLTIVFTILISLILCNFLFDSKIIGFLVLLIPISEVVLQIINKILGKMKFTLQKHGKL